MLKKTITYKDFNEEEVSEDFYFHLSKAELVELELSHKGGLSEALQEIIASEDGKAIIKQFKDIILGSYGIRSADGKRFTKNQQIREEFESTEAYSVLFMDLVTNVDSAIEFVNGIIPAGMAEEAAKIANPQTPETPPGETPQIALAPEPRIISRVEFQQMSSAEISSLAPQLMSGEAVIAES